MSKYEVKSLVNYPVKDVFRTFIEMASQGFNRFDKENPIGAKNKRVVRRSKDGDVYFETEVTDYVLNKKYQTSGNLLGSKYKSTYEFNEVDSNTTEVILIEEQDMYGIVNNIGFFFQKLTAKKQIQKKLNTSMEHLENQIEKEIRKTENKKKAQ